jgi:hypothetical protein
MTRVYQRPQAAGPRTRALVIGAGGYPHAKGADASVPVLSDLSSVGHGVRDFVTKLIRDWRDDLFAPLGSVDFLLSNAAKPGEAAVPATWSALGIDGEASDGAPIDAPSLVNVTRALNDALQGAALEDHFLFLCCGHGFWKEQRCFVLSDFGENPDNPWTRVILLDDFSNGIKQKRPRHQWLFFDCCSDMPQEVLEVRGAVGDPLIQPTKAGLQQARQQFGPHFQFGLASSTLGTQAFGMPDEPSRFCEMLMDAFEAAGAIERINDAWCVDQYGMQRAIDTYVDRKPDLANPDFYKYVTPVSSDAPSRMLLRRLPDAPTSRVIATSSPRTALRDADVTITRDGATQPVWRQARPQARVKLHIDVPARWHYHVTATFDGGNTQTKEIFAGLPLAEPVEFKV